MSTSSQRLLSPVQRLMSPIVAVLERRARPWCARWDKPLSNAPTSQLRADGTACRGINAIALAAAAFKAGYHSPYWLTSQEVQDLGGIIREGAHGQFVIRDFEVSRALQGYIVFNGRQIDDLYGCLDDPMPTMIAPIRDLRRLFGHVPANIRHGGERAYYAPETDHVQMPSEAAFGDAHLYYATLVHELARWSLASSRLGRVVIAHVNDDPDRALERLIADLCAAFIGSAIGLPVNHLDDQARYIPNWLALAQNAPTAFVDAAEQAQMAADYLLDLMGEGD